MYSHRFALRNYAGVPVRTFFVEENIIEDSNVEVDPNPSHMILVVDCSGSMYYTLTEIKGMLEKLLAVEEFTESNMLVSLISYASDGDVRSHFERVPVADVMASGSAHISAIRELRTRGLTCISQSLSLAKTLVRDGETTCISLHSDGYANHRSPYSEKQAIEKLTTELASMPGVFINTIAYSNWSDFQMLSNIANAASGTCLRANNVREVHTALHDTGKLLAGDMSPAAVSEVGGADLQVFLSANARKTLGSNEDLTIRGLSADDDKVVYRYTECSLDEYNGSDLPEVGADGVSTMPAFAFARANLAMGNVNAAKYAVVTTRAFDLLSTHYRALTGPQLADFASDIEGFLFADVSEWDTSEGYGLDLSRPSVLAVADILSNHTNQFRVNVPELRSGYTRRGLKRVPGTRDEDGNLVAPTTESTNREDSTLQRVTGFEINRNTATINMRLTRPIRLRDTESGEFIDEIAGIPLDLSAFNNYTLVGDGETLVEALPIQISSKILFAKLRTLDADLLTDDTGEVVDTFDPEQTVWIELDELPLVDFNGSYSMPGSFDTIATLTSVQKFLSALTKGTSTEYTGEQIAALKERHVTPSLYFSPPTTNTYTDLNEALEKGLVDTRLSYKINYGVTDLTDLGKILSGNKCFERFFTVERNGEAVNKPKLPEILEEGSVIGYKTLSARTKITTVDNVQKPVFEALLGLAEDYDSAPVVNALVSAGVNVSELLDVTARRIVRGDDAMARLKEAERKVNAALGEVYHNTISPLVFFIGATGLVPDDLNATAMTADEFSEAYPDTKLEKAEKEATFFVVGNEVLSVYVKGEHFTTEHGLKAVA